MLQQETRWIRYDTTKLITNNNVENHIYIIPDTRRLYSNNTINSYFDYPGNQVQVECIGLYHVMPPSTELRRALFYSVQPVSRNVISLRWFRRPRCMSNVNRLNKQMNQTKRKIPEGSRTRAMVSQPIRCRLLFIHPAYTIAIWFWVFSSLLVQIVEKILSY